MSSATASPCPDPPSDPPSDQTVFERLAAVPLTDVSKVSEWWQDSDFMNQWKGIDPIAMTFHQRMSDVLTILTGPLVSFAYELARCGRMKGLTERSIDSIGRPNDIDHGWDDEIRRGVCEWLSTGTVPRDEVEQSLMRGLKFRQWAERYEQALFRSAIVNSWSAFETLVMDLWTQAVDAAPQQLGVNVLRALEGGISAKKLRKVKVADLLAAGRIGSFAVGELHGKSSLPGIGDAYRMAFGDLPTLGKTLDRGNRALHELAETRHLIVHRGGVIDEKYLDETGVAKSVNDHLHFEPNTVGALTAAANESGLIVLKAVDGWFRQSGLFALA